MNPSSLLIDETAATHGVYKRLNIRSTPAVSGVRTASTPPSAPKSISITDTTLSFAINPLIRAVTILQSPIPRGLNNGAMIPAIKAMMLSAESLTRSKWKLKLCRNHTMIVATNMIVNAF